MRTTALTFARLLDADEDALGPDTPLTAVEGWDSVNALRVLVALERETAAPLDYERFAAAATLGDIAAAVAAAGGRTA